MCEQTLPQGGGRQGRGLALTEAPGEERAPRHSAAPGRGGRVLGGLHGGDRGTADTPALCKGLCHCKSSKLSGHGTRTNSRSLPARSPLQGYTAGMQGTLLTLYQTTIIWR